jgi:toxoflavin synthase
MISQASACYVRDGAPTDFDRIENYAGYIRQDPFRMGLHYPAVEAALGDVGGKRILDIGCGDGLFPRLLAGRGACVVGFDKAMEKIAEARRHKGAQLLDVSYVHATPCSFRHGGTFDAAVSVLALHYAASVEELAGFFRCACRHLVGGGLLVAIVLNPAFRAFATDFFVRRFTKIAGNRVRAEFLDPASGKIEMTVESHQYAKHDYERAALAGGMKPPSWKPLFAAPDAVERLGETFWRPCHNAQPFALFTAKKQ